MNPSKFDSIVKNRAQERVQHRIEIFRAEVRAAIHKVVANKFNPEYIGHFWQSEHANFLIPGLKDNVWPAYFWEQETEAVTRELLSTMDEMQKALCAPEVVEGPDTAKPAPDKTTA